MATRIICDRCGKEIDQKEINGVRLPSENKKYVTHSHEICDDCCSAIREFLHNNDKNNIIDDRATMYDLITSMDREQLAEFLAVGFDDSFARYRIEKAGKGVVMDDYTMRILIRRYLAQLIK